MNLWIRSQDRKTLERVDSVTLDNNRVVTRDWERELGDYKTEKRALEVMDEIQSVLLNFDKVGYTDPYKNVYTGGNFCIYEMPKGR